jgi:gamma-glutamylputrescine oxidase
MLLQNWWFTTLLGTPQKINPPLQKDIRADVLVVGAGAAGISAAYFFIDKGLKVVVLEKNIFGGSSSGKSAGFLTPDSELELSQLLRRFGKEGAERLWQVATTGVKMMADRVVRNKIACDFQEQDSLFLGEGKSGWQAVQEEVRSREALGFEHTLYDGEAVRRVIGTGAYSGAVSYSGTYGIDALLYCQGMKEVLLQHGVSIYESSEVLSIKDHCARTHLGSVTAGQIIVCADKLDPSLTPYAANIYHAQTFLSVSEPLGDDLVRSLFPEKRYQCWDSSLVYTYFRLTGQNRLLLGGGNMRTTFSKNDVTTTRVIDHVIRGFKTAFPNLKDLKFIQYWPGRIDTTRDLLPTIVRDARMPWLHVVLGCVGLPWATFCGDFAARHAYDTRAWSDHHYYDYFRPDRKFLLPLWLEGLLGKQIVFSVNNGWAKYYQVDRRRKY